MFLYRKGPHRKRCGPETLDVAIVDRGACIEGPLERASVDDECHDDLEGRDHGEHEEFGVPEDAESRYPQCAEHQEEQIDDADSEHEQRFDGVVDAGLRDSQEFRHGGECAEQVEDLDGRERIAAEDREEDRSRVGHQEADEHVDDKDIDEAWEIAHESACLALGLQCSTHAHCRGSFSHSCAPCVDPMRSQTGDRSVHKVQ